MSEQSFLAEEIPGTGLEIAVIGMTGKFPGAGDIHNFWENLKNGVEAVSFFTDKELQEAGIDEKLLKNPDYVKSRVILENIEYFDASFFNYSPVEAETMDPQLRFLHECAWAALEDAGYDTYSSEKLIGIYAGASINSFWEVLAFQAGLIGILGGYDASQLIKRDFFCTRIAHRLNLKGPAVAVQTTCSTSLAAIHMACQGLITGDCDMALAGGVCINPLNNQGYLYQEGMIISPDGHCRTFDQKAMGTITGEGVGIVVLKRLENALAHRDHIYAVVKGSAMNNDGRDKASYTAPGIEGQSEVIRTALQAAEVEPETIGYVECHGTATILGDPIEIQSLKQAFDTNKEHFCPLGSVKTNMGHLDAAAGITGFIKTVLTLRHRIIPPSLHFEKPNPKIDFKHSPFYINTKLLPWKRGEHPLRAGVSSFGIGGTNVHIILEEAPTNHRDKEGTRGLAPLINAEISSEYQLILLSAKTGTALEQMTENLAAHLKKNPQTNLSDIAYTLQTGRGAFKYRKMLTASHVHEVIERLSSAGANPGETFTVENDEPYVIFMFPGQGSQYVNMGEDLYKKEPVFREEMDRCFEILNSHLNYDIKKILYPHPGCRGGSPCPPKDCVRSPGQGDHRGSPLQSDHINQTEITQPLLFVFEYALAKLMMKWGIKPDAMIGHSIGEYVAAHLAGVFSLEDALALVALRGKLMQEIPPGSMLAVSLSEEQVNPLINQNISIAAVNSPSTCVVSGPHRAIETFTKQLLEQGCECTRLHTSHAFHSKMMEPIITEFEAKVRNIKLNKPKIRCISNLTGQWLTHRQVVDYKYWGKHLRRTVRFNHGLEELLKKDSSLFIEVGPGQTLSTLVRQHPDKKPGILAVNLVRHPKEKQKECEPDDRFLLTKLGQLWLYGINIHWNELYQGQKRQRIPLPTYPFEGRRYWPEYEPVKIGAGMLSKKSQLNKNPDISEWFYVPSWKRSGWADAEELLIETNHPVFMLFIDKTHLGRQLAKKIKQKGGRVILVKTGPGFGNESPHVYQINPGESSHYDTLMSQLQTAGNIPGTIIHLWNVTGHSKGELNPEHIKTTLDLGFYSLINLARAIAKLHHTGDIKIKVVSNKMHEFTGDEDICPEKSMVLGPLKVIPQEYPNINCQSIDIILPEPGSKNQHRIIRQLFTELIGDSPDTNRNMDTVVAYRGDFRWVQIFEPLESLKAKQWENPGEGPSLVKTGGVYLVTGGLGKIGFLLAQYLATTLKARLVLTGRSPFPPREQWEKWLDTHGHDEKDRVSRQILKIQELEKSGAEISVFKADAANFEQMQNVITHAEEQYGRLDGVIHCAGVTQDAIKPVDLPGKNHCEEQFQSKVYGSLVLKKIFKDKKEKAPGFCLLMSSLSAVLGGLGFAAYSAANLFMDSLVYTQDYNYNQENHCHWISVNWDGWQYSEKDRLAMNPEEGIKVFRHIMSLKGVRQVVVSTGDLHDRIHRWIRLETLNDREYRDREVDVSSTHARPDLSTAYAVSRNPLEQKLTEIWQNFFRIEEIGIHDNFFQIGGDSLKGMTLVNRYKELLRENIHVGVVFEAPTIAELAAFFTQHYSRAVMAVTGSHTKLGEIKRKYVNIKTAEKKEYYPLSSAQKRLYFIQQMDLTSTSYNRPFVFSLGKDLEKDKLELILKKLITRHESLRTSFITVNEIPVQRIHEGAVHPPDKGVEFEVKYYDLQVAGASDRCRGEKEDIEGTRGLATQPIEPAVSTIQNFIRPFDLSQAPLIRAGLIKQEMKNAILVIDMHHIITDGITQNILTREFMSLYSYPGEEFPPLKFQYKDYSQWQHSEKKEQSIKQQENYWLNLFSDEPPVLQLPTDFPRPVIKSFAGSSLDFVLNEKESEKLKNIAKEKDATLFMAILSILTILLSKLGSQEDIVVGTPIAARGHADLEPIVGMFANTLALRNYPAGCKTYDQFLEEVKKSTIAAYDNQEYQFEELVDKISANRDTSRSPVFDVMFSLQNQIKGPNDSLVEDTLNHSISIKNIHTTALFDVVFHATEVNDSIHCLIEYCTKLFKQETIEKFINYFKKIIASISKNPGQKLSELEIITGEEKREILKISTGKKECLPINRTIHQIFEEKAGEIPGKTAVVFNHQYYSYSQINHLANQLARMLRSKGVKPGNIVGVMVERSVEMIAAILAVMKAGAAFLPIDPGYPINRILEMLNDSNPSILLTQGSTLENFSTTELLGIQPVKVAPQQTNPRPPADFINFPKPDRSLIDYNKYRPYIGHAMVKHSIALQPTRGCPFHCAFCHRIWPKKHTFRSAENLLEEVELYYKLGVRRFVIIDDVFNFNIKNSSKFFQLIIKRGLSIQLFFPNGLRGDILTKEYIDLMVEAGTVNLDVALETASPRLQKLIKKNLDLDKLRQNLEYLCTRYPHVIIDLGMMIGFPSETEEEAMMTMDFLKSIHWVHFPYPFILKIHPRTDIGKLALEHGVSARAIARSMNQSYHDIPETLPFSKKFAREFKAKFLSDYFFLEQRLLQVLPYQLKVASENELVQKYNNYLPMEVKHLSDILNYANIAREKLETVEFINDDDFAIPDLNEKIKRHFPHVKKDKNALKVLLLDLSELFTGEQQDILHGEIPEPLGILSLATFLRHRFKHRVKAKIAKSKVDFDSYEELKVMINQFAPDLIGIRTLSYYKDFFHRTITYIRNWAITVPIVAGGPYASMDYDILLQDPNIDLAVLGEGEITLAHLVDKMLENGKKMPPENILQDIPGIAYIGKADKEKLKKASREIVVLDKAKEQLILQPGTNLPITNQSTDLVYVIYTSGSTGKPKGAMLEHRNLVNLLQSQFKHTNIDCSRILQFATISFDASFHEILSALLSGGTLFLVDKETRGNLADLLDIIGRNGIKTVFLPMSFLDLIFSEEEYIGLIPSCIEHIQTAGEQVMINDAFREYLRRNHVYLHNHYGPSETHVVTTLTLNPLGVIPRLPSIGKPIFNTGIYILDKGNHLVPQGVVGELYIGGEQVGRGYLDRPELTAEKFICAECKAQSAKRLMRSALRKAQSPGQNKERHALCAVRRASIYQTGDLSRWLSDGNIEFLGRVDHQVKIRGFRVELGEIESQLLNHPGIKEAVVLARWDDSGKRDKYLCAYIIPDSNIEYEISDLRQYLSMSLPDYMLPGYFTQIEKIPLLPNGKINRSALPVPEVKAGDGYIAPRNTVEKKLLGIWSGVLAIDKDVIGIDSNFFELGGHSLKATTLAAKIHKELDVKIPLIEIFKTPTIRGLSQYTAGAAEDKFTSIEPVEKREYYALSSAQERLYILQQMDPESTAYNLSSIINLEGELEKGIFEDNFRILIERHESLRTSFEKVNRQLVQKVHDKVEFEIQYGEILNRDWGGASNSGQETENSLVKRAIENFIRPFDLSMAPLLRAVLLKVSTVQHLLLFDMHHILVDNTSLQILERDYMALYSGEKLPPLRIFYKEYVEWWYSPRQQERIKRQEAYWTSLFPQEPQVLNLPTDYPRPPEQSFEGNTVNVALDEKQKKQLKALAQQEDATLFMTLLAIFTILLSKLSGQDEIIVGTPIAGREHIDVENIVGDFVNTLPIKTCPASNKTFSTFLKEVKSHVLEVFENQDYPFNELVERVLGQRDVSRHPIFDIAFNLVEQSESTDHTPGYDNSNEDRSGKFKSITTKFDIGFVVLQSKETFRLVFEYCTKLFKQETMEMYGKNFEKIISQVVSNKQIKINDIELLDEANEIGEIYSEIHRDRESINIGFDI